MSGPVAFSGLHDGEGSAEYHVTREGFSEAWRVHKTTGPITALAMVLGTTSWGPIVDAVAEGECRFVDCGPGGWRVDYRGARYIVREVS